MDLAERYARWVNQVEVTVGTDGLGILTPETEREWLQRVMKEDAERRPASASFTVYDRSDLTPVGTTGLFRIDHRDRTAEFGIELGERRGRGLGTEAARLKLDWAFTVLSLHNVMLRAFATNERALRSYLRAGFREIGRRREAALVRGAFVDEVYMDALSTEFTGSVLRPAGGSGAGGPGGARAAAPGWRRHGPAPRSRDRAAPPPPVP